LTDARTACISQNETTDSFKSANLTVTLNGSTDLLRARSDSELALNIETMLSSFTGNRSRARHVLVRRVSAGTDESDLEFLGPVVLLDLLSKLRERGGKIRSEGTVDVRLEFGEVLGAGYQSRRRGR